MTPTTHQLPPEVTQAVRAMLAERAMADYVREALREIVGIDTLSTPNLAETARREQAVLACLEKRIAEALPGALRIERLGILPDIDRCRQYTMPSYARRPDGSVPPAAQVYAGRYNLLATLPAGRADGLAINAHVDVVAPYFPYSEHDGRLWGRGTVDDKGQCVAMLVAARLLGALRRDPAIAPPRDLTFQFVIDEEIGGNGSLSAAADPRCRFGCVCVCEPTGLTAHPANRGAVWYRVDVQAAEGADLNATLAAGRVLLELRAEGDRIKAESSHPLFPERPVQTCNGILGTWGPHPSRVCPMVGLCIRGGPDAPRDLAAAVQGACRRGVELYCERYGDATRQPDPDNPGRPKVARHYDLLRRDAYVFAAIYGKSGHMGRIDQLDCAATKAAYVLQALEEDLGASAVVQLAEGPPQERQAAPAGPQDTLLVGGPDSGSLRRVVMEGGQGFLPTHDIDQVQERIAQAARRGAEQYCRLRGLGPDAVKVTATFQRLHNNAFERPVDSAGMQTALAALRAAGLDRGEPVRGWEVSCDARLFADLRPEADVVSFGPGNLRCAHSDEESITVQEILQGAEALAYMALLYGR